jgi:hypothetical protein
MDTTMGRASLNARSSRRLLTFRNWRTVTGFVHLRLPLLEILGLNPSTIPSSRHMSLVLILQLSAGFVYPPRKVLHPLCSANSALLRGTESYASEW